MQLKASIIIPTVNRGPALLETLESLKHQDMPLDDFEVLIVDSTPGGVHPQVEKYLNARAGQMNVRYLREERMGVHNARHTGVLNQRSQIFVQIEDDAVAEPYWLSELLRPFDDPGVACVGGMIKLRFEAKPPSWVSDHYDALSYYYRGEKLKDVDEGDYVAACNMAIRKSVLLDIGGFNPCLMNGRCVGDGEVGMLRKLRECNAGRIVYAPRALVHHIVPERRMTAAYMRWRYLNDGRGRVQSLVQSINPNKSQVLREAIISGLMAIAYTALAVASRLISERKSLKWQVRAMSRTGYASRCIGLLWRHGEFAFLMRRDWLSAS